MTRAAMHRLVDELPDGELDKLAALFEAARAGDRVLVQSLLAEDEPLEPGDAEALAEVDRDDSMTGEALERRLGIR